MPVDLRVQLVQAHYFINKTKMYKIFADQGHRSWSDVFSPVVLPSSGPSSSLPFHSPRIPAFSNDGSAMLQFTPSFNISLYSQLQKKYGSVFTVYFGPRPVVILCGHEAVKEALVDQADDFSGRGEMPTMEKNFQGYGE